MAKAAAQKKKRVGAGLLTKVLVLVLAAGIGWQLYQLRDQVQSAQLQKETLAAQVQEKQQENDALSADIAQGSTQEKMEEMARQELGLVYPGERVFYDTSN
ncbi:FtsB family cell division protein [Dysosmobacter sp.]